MATKSGDAKGKEERLDRDHLFLLLAWWMDMSPQARDPKSTCKAERNGESKLHKVGVVIKRADGTFLDADCTRENIHPAIRLIMKHGTNIEGCDIFMSRLPCAKCSKHIVQAKLNRVVYLDMKNRELNDETDRQHAINHFLRSMPLVEMVPEIPESYQEEVGSLHTDFSKYDIAEERHPHVALEENEKRSMQDAFKKARRWLYDHTYYKTPEHKGMGDREKVIVHALRMADILSTRADDPDGVKVGAVLLQEVGASLCIVGAGWNGYPRGAVKYNYPMGKSDKLRSLIHAENNALLYRSDKAVRPQIAVINKRPCEDCFQTLESFGVEKFYFKEKADKQATNKDLMAYHWWTESDSTKGYRYEDGKFEEAKNETPSQK